MNKPIFALLFLCCTSAFAQGNSGDSLSIDLEMQGSFSNSKTPLWLNANKHGLGSLSSDNGYLRAMGVYEKSFNEDTYGLTVGLDMAVAFNYKTSGYKNSYRSHLIIQQAYLEGRYKMGVVTIGAKYQSMELLNDDLSSGAQTFGINARPIPQVRVGLSDYWSIPLTRNWLSFKGHLAYGVMTDGAWEESFAKGSEHKFNRNTRYHQKAGYFRIGNTEKFPLTFTIGLEMAAQFGGHVYNWNGNSQDTTVVAYDVALSSSPRSYFNAFVGSGSDNGESKFKNAEGNLLGSWVARLNWNDDNIEVGAYVDHFFEDHSALFFLDYDGYGGKDNNEKLDSRFFRYDFKDALVGLDIKLKNFSYVNQAVVEYMNTRYQSGPVYHDHNQTLATHICGNDQYYNNMIFPGWQHWGQVIGNPLYTSPVYNTDGYIGVENNRFKAWHFAVAGDPFDGFHYRAKLSWQKGWGTYDNPFLYPKDNTSILLEAMYRFADDSHLAGTSVNFAYGADFGSLLGNNSGVQLTVKYSIR